MQRPGVGGGASPLQSSTTERNRRPRRSALEMVPICGVGTLTAHVGITTVTPSDPALPVWIRLNWTFHTRGSSPCSPVGLVPSPSIVYPGSVHAAMATSDSSLLWLSVIPATDGARFSPPVSS